MLLVFGYFVMLAAIALACGFLALVSAFFAFRSRFTNWTAVWAFLLGAALGLPVPILWRDAKVKQGWQVLSVLAICALSGGLLSGIGYLPRSPSSSDYFCGGFCAGGLFVSGFFSGVFSTSLPSNRIVDLAPNRL